MSRPVRIEFPGASNYISCYAIQDSSLFRTDEDRAVFLNILGSVADQFRWRVFGYVLLDGHYHLLLELTQANLSRGMQQLNGVYTQHYNRTHNRTGTLFRGRFQTVIFELKKYLAPLYCHMVLNPVRTGDVKDPIEYKWSSHRQIVGEIKGQEFIEAKKLLSRFAKSQQEARKKYHVYVKEALGQIGEIESPLEKKRHQILLGSDRFVEEILPQLNRGRAKSKTSKHARSAGRKTGLKGLFAEVENKTRLERNLIIMRAHYEHHYSLSEIGDYLGLHYTTISRVVNSK